MVAGDPEPSADRPRFLVDAMCGTLATHLRMCGYDAAFVLDRGIEDDDRIAALSAAEDRVLLTRDRELAARVDGRPDGVAVVLTERAVRDQLRAVAAAGYPVALADEPTRCGSCNGPVERVAPGADRPEYVPDPDPDGPRRFWRCRDCGQWFWKGGHWAAVAERIDGI